MKFWRVRTVLSFVFKDIDGNKHAILLAAFPKDHNPVEYDVKSSRWWYRHLIFSLIGSSQIRTKIEKGAQKYGCAHCGLWRIASAAARNASAGSRFALRFV